MRTAILIPILALLIVISAFSVKSPSFSPTTKIVGVYDHDSVLYGTKSYDNYLDSEAVNIGMNAKKLRLMESEYVRLTEEFNRDSLKWSSETKESKRVDIIDLNTRILIFKNDIRDTEHMHMSFFENSISKMALKLAKEKRYDAVLTKEQLEPYLVQNPGTKIINVTTVMIQKLDTRK